MNALCTASTALLSGLDAMASAHYLRLLKHIVVCPDFGPHCMTGPPWISLLETPVPCVLRHVFEFGCRHLCVCFQLGRHSRGGWRIVWLRTRLPGDRHGKS